MVAVERAGEAEAQPSLTGRAELINEDFLLGSCWYSHLWVSYQLILADPNGRNESLLKLLRRRGINVEIRADIAEMVGARREDFDRVRHAASGTQRDLPGRRRRGEI